MADNLEIGDLTKRYGRKAPVATEAPQVAPPAAPAAPGNLTKQYGRRDTPSIQAVSDHVKHINELAAAQPGYQSQEATVYHALPFNWGDKLRAYTLQGAQGIKGALGYPSTVPPGTSSQDLTEATEVQRKQYEQQHPLENAAAKVVGNTAALALPAAAGARALTGLAGATQGASPLIAGATRFIAGQAGAGTGSGLAQGALRVASKAASGAIQGEALNTEANLANGKPATENWKPAGLISGGIPGVTAAAGEIAPTVMGASYEPTKALIMRAASRLGYNPPPAASSNYANMDANLRNIPGTTIGHPNIPADGGDSQQRMAIGRALGIPDGQDLNASTLAAAKNAAGRTIGDIASRSNPRLDDPDFLAELARLRGKIQDKAVYNPQEIQQGNAILDNLDKYLADPAHHFTMTPPTGPTTVNVNGSVLRHFSDSNSDLYGIATKNGPDAQNIADFAQELRGVISNHVKRGITDPAELNAYQDNLERYMAAEHIEPTLAPTSPASSRVVLPVRAERQLGIATPNDYNNPDPGPLSQVRILTSAGKIANQHTGSTTAKNITDIAAGATVPGALMAGPGPAAAVLSPLVAANATRGTLNSNAMREMLGTAEANPPANPLAPFIGAGVSQALPDQNPNGGGIGLPPLPHVPGLWPYWTGGH